MSLFDREIFEQFVGALTGAHIVHQWGGASVGKLGGKIFATLSDWHASGELAVNFKCSDLSFTLLTELDGVMPAKYLARAKWVTVRRVAPLSEDEIRAYIGEAHRLVALKLTRRERAELGLDSLQSTTA